MCPCTIYLLNKKFRFFMRITKGYLYCILVCLYVRNMQIRPPHCADIVFVLTESINLEGRITLHVGDEVIGTCSQFGRQILFVGFDRSLGN